MKSTVLIATLALTIVAGCGKKSDPVPASPEPTLAEKPTPLDEVKYDALDWDRYNIVGDRPDYLDGLLDNFRRVHFPVGSAELSAAAKKHLNVNAEVLKEHPYVWIEVQGYADERGDAASNKQLGMARAKAVHTYLATSGVDVARVAMVSFGENRPLVDPDKAKVESLAWAKNRRVEFYVTWDPNNHVDSSNDNTVTRPPSESTATRPE